MKRFIRFFCAEGSGPEPSDSLIDDIKSIRFTNILRHFIMNLEKEIPLLQRQI